MVKNWTEQRSRILVETSIFTLKAHERSSQMSDKAGEFYVVHARDWVNVIAFTDAGQVLLVEQYRHGTGRITVEIPAGMVDDGETPIQAARRELLEETGFTSSDWIDIGTVEPNPAILSNRCHTFLARDAVRTHEPRLDGNEEIHVQAATLDVVEGWIRDRRIDHALVLAAFYWLHLFEKYGGHGHSSQQ